MDTMMSVYAAPEKMRFLLQPISGELRVTMRKNKAAQPRVLAEAVLETIGALCVCACDVCV